MMATARRLADLVDLATMPPADLLARTSSALLMIDLQNRFLFHPDGTEASTMRVLKPAETLLAAARAFDIPRYYVTVAAAPGFSDEAAHMRRLHAMSHNVQGRLTSPPMPAHASKIVDSLTPLPGEIHLTKWRFSAFYETGLDILLRGAGIETVVIAGVASYGCIIATYIDAVSRGFHPLLCGDAVDGADEKMHRAAMDFMTEHCCLGIEEILSVWKSKKAVLF
jgi:nicotinamidase-related amidase